MKAKLAGILALCLLLSGCSGLLDGSYVHVETHPVETVQPEENISVSSYSGLLETIRQMVAEGEERGVISVARYDQEKVESHMAIAVDYVLHRDPLGAYAVSEITYELGTSAGQSAVSLSISYIHDRSEIKKIQSAENLAQVEAAMTNALDQCESSVVLYVENYQEMDFAQWVSGYATANPDKVMEVPEVTANLYPESGSDRILELKFSYQNTRDVLRAMQETVSDLFAKAVADARKETHQQDQYLKLGISLMDAPRIRVETSITPAYSLLQHGVGDSRAFATVYTAMSIRTGLECWTVTGTKAGEPWYWNIVCSDGVYYHLDLLEGSLEMGFQFLLDEQMDGYVWDYFSYPACVIPEALEADQTVE